MIRKTEEGIKELETTDIRSYEVVLNLSITPKSNDGRYQSSYTAYELKMSIGDLREHGQRASEFLSEEFKRFVNLQNKIERGRSEHNGQFIQDIQ